MESTLIKSEDDTKLGATTNYLDDRVKIQKKILTGWTGGPKETRLNLIGTNITFCT